MTDRMQRWVITGPVGAGKSALAGMLGARGAALINGDEIGHELLLRPEVIERIACSFGPEVLRDGRVDRATLGRIVFADARALARLSAITHPSLAAEAQRRFEEIEAAGRWSLAVLEAAVYFLLPSLGTVDLTISVVASEAVRLDRLVASGRWSRREADRRIAAQRNMEADWPRADVVLRNEGTTADFRREAAAALGRYWRGLDAGGRADVKGS